MRTRDVLEGLDDSGHAIVPPYPQVVALRDVMGEDDLEFVPIRESTVSNTLRSRDWASSTTTKASCSERPRMCVGKHLEHAAIDDLVHDFLGGAPNVSKTACPHGDIFSFSVPGR